MSVKILEVNKDNDERRLDNYLISIYKNVPKSKIYNIIRKGEVRVNSGRVKPYLKIKTGDLIRIPPYLNIENSKPKKIDQKLKDDIKKNILYESSNFLIINKQHGIAVHSGSKNNFGIIDIIRSIYGDSLDLCHRIDKETSGCLVLAKNKKANKSFSNQLVNKNIKKKYLAILKGHLKKKKIVDTLIDKNLSGAQKSFINNDKGKDSLSIFKPLKKLNSSCLVEIEIFTGRTHQIRVQSSYIGHPVLNDEKYGDREFNKNIFNKQFQRMALHSSEIEFLDSDNKSIRIKAEPDDSFLDMVAFLK
ncbi:MAG: RluA family pseudouridine synthase [Proteobacteria bacterium]|jgi:23S rRNA pseudouridine955/2504/2580 synthase|nr:RluA family pseudouridine synthase [Pseudomonadota bacterium]